MRDSARCLGGNRERTATGFVVKVLGGDASGDTQCPASPTRSAVVMGGFRIGKRSDRCIRPWDWD